MVEKGRAALKVTMRSEREIVMTRVFDAPRRLVFDAMTMPEHVQHWWGPHGYTLPVCEIDLRPGGAYRFVNRAPDGGDHPFKGVYREIVPPERLVFTQIYDVEPWSSDEVLVTVNLVERGGKTTMTSISLFESREDREGMVNSGMEKGAAESYERLDERLRTMG